MTVETRETRVIHRPVYAYPLISWGGVLAGAAVALALGALLAVLGVAIGATTFNPYDLQRDAKVITIGGGLWVLFANLVAMQVGGFVAARTSRFSDHTNGLLQGLAVWAVALIAAMVLAGASLSAGMDGAASAALDQASAPPAADVASPPSARGYDQPTDAQITEMARAAKVATETLAWWAFAAMALGAVGAMAGGRIGSDHPVWLDRPRESAALL